jgi:hypothetical protein
MLKPEASLMVGLATAAVVYSVYSGAFPSVVDVRTNPPEDLDVARTERTAAVLSTGVVAGISLIAKDPTVFIIGGLTVLGMSWWYRHANVVNPEYGMANPESDNLNEQFSDQNMAAAETYGEYAGTAF